MDEITKEGLKFLNKIFRFKKRTIATCSIKNSAHLKEVWEEAQYEFCSEYQYAGADDNVWDYYLVFCCDFDIQNLDSKDRLEIESDKFCCRKYFLFNTSAATCTEKKLIETLFPEIKITTNIEMLKPQKLIDQIEDGNLLSVDFFTKSKSEDEIKSITNRLLKS